MTITLVNDTILDDYEISSISSLFDNNNNDSGEVTHPVISNSHKNEYNNDVNKIDIFKDLIITLQDQISDLKEEVIFLREDSLSKSTMINNLISVTRTIHDKRINNDNSNNNNNDNTDNNNKNNNINNVKNVNCDNSTSSSDSSNITNYNDNISVYNNQVSMDNNTNGGSNTDDNNDDDNNLETRHNLTPSALNNILNELGSTPIRKQTNTADVSQHYHHFPPVTGSNNGSNDDMYESINSDSDFDMSSSEISPTNKVGTKPRILPSIYEKPLEECAKWKKGTTLIIGDSLLYGIDESKLKDTKVRIYPGAGIEDTYYNIFPLLRKEPTNIILHVGTNDATSESSFNIVRKLFELKNFVMSELPYCKVIFSGLISRFDKAKPQLTVERVNERLVNSGLQIIDNSNITRQHLGKRGLHMNPHGTGKLAVNLIKVLKTL